LLHPFTQSLTQGGELLLIHWQRSRAWGGPQAREVQKFTTPCGFHWLCFEVDVIQEHIQVGVAPVLHELGSQLGDLLRNARSLEVFGRKNEPARGLAALEVTDFDVRASQKCSHFSGIRTEMEKAPSELRQRLAGVAPPPFEVGEVEELNEAGGGGGRHRLQASLTVDLLDEGQKFERHQHFECIIGRSAGGIGGCVGQGC